MKDSKTKCKFVERVKELVNIVAQDLWKSFKEGILQACDEMCGKKRGRRDREDTWWWNEEVHVKDAIARRKQLTKTYVGMILKKIRPDTRA